MSLLKDITTAKDGESFDVGRVLLLAIALGFVILAFWDIVILAHAFNPKDYGIGGGSILGGGGAGIGFKKDTEPTS